MDRVRIYTEDVNNTAIGVIIGKVFDGYTVFKAQGVRQGVSENSICIEIVDEFIPETTVVEICNRIKAVNYQESVLYTMEKVDVHFV